VLFDKMGSSKAGYGAVEEEASLLPTKSEHRDKRRRVGLRIVVGLVFGSGVLFLAAGTAFANRPRRGKAKKPLKKAGKLRQIFYINCDFSVDRRQL
jgi:hypothetical protein